MLDKELSHLSKNSPKYEIMQKDLEECRQNLAALLDKKHSDRIGHLLAPKIKEAAVRGMSLETLLAELSPEERKMLEERYIEGFRTMLNLQENSSIWERNVRSCQRNPLGCYYGLEDKLAPPEGPFVQYVGVGAPRSAVVPFTYSLCRKGLEGEDCAGGLQEGLGFLEWGGAKGKFLDVSKMVDSETARKMSQITQRATQEVIPHLDIVKSMPEQFMGNILGLFKGVDLEVVGNRWTMKIFLSPVADIEEDYLRENLLRQLSKMRPGAEVRYVQTENDKGEKRFAIVISFEERPEVVGCPSPGVPSVTSAELANNTVENGELELYRWVDAGKNTYFIDFASPQLQSDYLDRIVYFTEVEKGVVMPKERGERYKKISGVNGRNRLRDGNNLTAKDIANFFNAVPPAELTREEGAILDCLRRQGIIIETGLPWDGQRYMGDPFTVVLTASQTDEDDLRKMVISHERIHGVIQSSPENVSRLRENFSRLNFIEKSILRTVLSGSKGYSSDDNTIMNEAVAYHLVGKNSDIFDSTDASYSLTDRYNQICWRLLVDLDIPEAEE